MELTNDTCESIVFSKNLCSDDIKCGRLVAIRRFDADRFVVVDAYRGIYLVDFQKGTHSNICNLSFKEKSELVFPTNRLVDGKRIEFINDIDVYNNDTVVFTASSTKWDLDRYFHILLEHIPDGRVIRYTLSSNEATVVLDKLYFPNGIQIQPDRMSFMVCETGMARIIRLVFDVCF